jgi:16S rRNA (adenine1518-N6/adenine1519-N6)-dimethyltransferase
VSGGPRQASLRRISEFSVRPNRELGQHFLIDDNILRVIGALAELDPADVVLEVGGGLGVLSEFLAPRIGHLHVVEIDRTLEAPLADALADHANATLHIADAMRLDFAALAPPPTKVVANLPYGVATGVLLKSIDELPQATRWVAMVQREVAERLVAAPGSRVYGIPSVLMQLSCSVRISRRLPPTVFHPPPNVQSALVLLERIAPAPGAEVRLLVQAAFAHRRKALAGSLALARATADVRTTADVRDAARTTADVRHAARTALTDLGKPPDARAESLSPDDFRALAAALGSRLAAT